VSNPETVLKKVRTICLGLADTAEQETWGHPTFVVAGRVFSVFEQYKGQWCLCFRVDPKHHDLFLKDSRFFVTPYIGKHGWLSLLVDAAPLDWKEIRHLVTESHRLVGSMPAHKRRPAKKSSSAD
jgi:predicted DNA-binding protein (MmcQ/YjbR family)